MVIVLCCMHCTSTRPEQVLWTSLVAAIRHLTDLTKPNLMQRLTNGFCHRCARSEEHCMWRQPRRTFQTPEFWCCIWFDSAVRLNGGGRVGGSIPLAFQQLRTCC